MFDLPDPLGPDDHGDPVWEFESRPISETFETGQFECFEHAKVSRSVSKNA